MKYIFVTGGVVSGLGKGICAASLGRLLKQCGLRVRNQKFDPYLNVDPGTMSPYQHGEVYVTEDGAETDLDLGHYERFVDEALDANSSVSSGKIYWSVLNSSAPRCRGWTRSAAHGCTARSPVPVLPPPGGWPPDRPTWIWVITNGSWMWR
mgnify:CR=1 FL=1